MPAKEDVRLYNQFLQTFIGPMFARCSSRIEDLQVATSIAPSNSVCALYICFSLAYSAPRGCRTFSSTGPVTKFQSRSRGGGQRVTQQLYPEYSRPVREGRIQAGQSQQLYTAFKDKATAARAAFESGLHNQLALTDAVTSRYKYDTSL